MLKIYCSSRKMVDSCVSLLLASYCFFYNTVAIGRCWIFGSVLEREAIRFGDGVLGVICNWGCGIGCLAGGLIVGFLTLFTLRLKSYQDPVPAQGN
ncbi:MAG: hypothetical protein ABIB97_01195 [Patescibacteria group bacterium]